MKTPNQSALSSAVHTLLTPLVRILLRNGVAFSTFADVVKKVYVDVAFQEFGEPGKKQTISRVSALTGLTRKETKRLHELSSDELEESANKYNRAIRIISGWLHDEDFLNSRGQPKSLPLDGATDSFTSLVKKYSGDIPTQAMLTVLLTSETVEKTRDNKVRLIKKAFIPSNDPIDKLRILGTDTAELISTIDHNLKADKSGLRFQRKVSNSRIDPDTLDEFKSFSSDKAQALLEELDDWLTTHEVSEGDSEQGTYVSLGIYYFQPQDGEETSS